MMAMNKLIPITSYTDIWCIAGRDLRWLRAAGATGPSSQIILDIIVDYYLKVDKGVS